MAVRTSQLAVPVFAATGADASHRVQELRACPEIRLVATPAMRRCCWSRGPSPPHMSKLSTGSTINSLAPCSHPVERDATKSDAETVVGGRERVVRAIMQGHERVEARPGRFLP